MRRPRHRTSPASARSWPVRMLKNVDLPAPFGPMSARISPRASANETPSTARTPPNARRTSTTSSTGVVSATPARSERAEDPTREDEDDRHENHAEHELPVLGVARHHRVEQLVERGADRRAGQRLHATEQDHHERLDGDGNGERLREHAALEEHEDAAREPAEEAGDDEGQPLVSAHVDADGLRAARMIARRAQRETERRAAGHGPHGQARAA